MKKLKLIILAALAAFSVKMNAQIGYQVALLNNATGVPRANETVEVTIKITDSEGTVYCSQTKKETSNDFGMLTLTVGDKKTFDDMDWQKLPFFIEVSVDETFLAKTQILSVPVAEYAKKAGFVLTPEYLEGTWSTIEDLGFTKYYISLEFNSNGEMWYKEVDAKGNVDKHFSGTYEIEGDVVFVFFGNYLDGICRFCGTSKKMWASLIGDCPFLTKQEK